MRRNTHQRWNPDFVKGDTLIATLKHHLGFQVDRVKLYWKNEAGKEIECKDRVALIKRWPGKELSQPDHDTELTTATPVYSTIQMKALIEPIEKMLVDGWELPPFVVGRRCPIQIERNGAEVYIELINKKKLVTIGDSKIWSRFVGFNSFTTATKAGGYGGGLEIRCCNGLYSAYNFRGLRPIRHIGDSQRHEIHLKALADEFMANYDSVAKEWNRMHHETPTTQQRCAAIDRLGFRYAPKIIDKLRRDGDDPAKCNSWRFMRAFTNYLSYDTKNRVSTIMKTEKDVRDILLGKKDTPIPTKFWLKENAKIAAEVGLGV